MKLLADVSSAGQRRLGRAKEEKEIEKDRETPSVSEEAGESDATTEPESGAVIPDNE
jgi:hypothetical protein